ncbi:MAG: LysM peptidoglycan-binding domain-containing protein [Trueperella sp.]|nr:LysM peptidoglycan-binding domain-containing protein [Trueperella sp.]
MALWRSAASPEAQFLSGLLGLTALASGAIFAWYAISLTAFLRASYRENRSALNLIARFSPPLVRRLAAAGLASPMILVGAPAFALPTATEVDFSAGAELPVSTQSILTPVATTSLPKPALATAPAPRPATVETRNITVVPGDTLWGIALRLTGDPAQANAAVQLIWEENREVIGDNPNLIYPNQILNIPENL